MQSRKFGCTRPLSFFLRLTKSSTGTLPASTQQVFVKTWKHLILNVLVITTLLCGGLMPTTSASAYAPASETLLAPLASPLDNCFGTASTPWKSGVTIHFSVRTECYPYRNYPNRIDLHELVVEVYRNGKLQRYVRARCHSTSYCQAETTFNDGPGNQTWCSVIEGIVYGLGLGGRVIPGEKACESESW